MKMIKNEAGFTLIEVIVSLIIMGILTALAGMAIVTGVKGYVFARDNAIISQKAQLAMSRLSRELMEITDITEVSEPTEVDETRLTYERLDDSGSSIIQTIYYDAGDMTTKIAVGPVAENGDTLVDGVSGFTLAYYKGADNWGVADGIELLTTIEINLVMTRSDGGSDVSFSATVNPRNTGSSGNDFY